MTGAMATPAPMRWRRPVPALDIVLALALLVWAVAATARDALVLHPWTELAAAVMAGALLLRTRAATTMAVVGAAGALAVALLPHASTPLWMFLTMLTLCFSVGAHLDGRRRWAALGLLLAAGYVLQLASVDRNDPSDNTFSEIWIAPLVIVGGPAFAGVLLQRSRRQTSELRRVSAELEAEREGHAHAAALAERHRIAREMHDVISHSVSVMVVQAGAAEQVLPPDSPALDQVRAVRATGKEALAELRRQLGMLRADATSPVGPMPGLDDLERLTSSSGATLRVEGDLGDVESPGLGLTAYRVVQEALTNAQRYAAGAEVRVSVSRVDGALDLLVEDCGGAASEGAGAGQGLRGLRERVELYGGRVDVGPREAGGWRVHARLPVGPGTTP